ncbi:unnamed protein product [Closterium sp. NIES-53]
MSAVLKCVRTVKSSPPLVLYKLGEYRCPPGCDGHYHHSWRSACVDLHVHTDGGSPAHIHSSATETSQLAASAQVSASGQVDTSCSYRLLSHQTLLWHHRLGHPSLPRLRGMHSRLLVSGLPRSLPPLPPSPALPCLPCIEGRQRAAPHSSSFPPTSAPLQPLHMDVCGPARVSGQSRKRYFVLVVDDYTQYTTVFPLHSKGQVVDVLIPWIRTLRLQLRERFGQDLPVMRLHSDRAPHWLSHGETSPTRRWTRTVGDASVFRVCGSRAFVHDTSADKLSPRAIPCVFLGFVPDVPGWQFYHPTSRRVFPSQDATFDELVPFYHLFPYHSAPPPPPPVFLAPGPRPVDPLPTQGPAPSGVSQVDPLPGPAPVQVAVDSGAARGAASGGAEPGGADFEGAKPGGVETGGAEPGGVPSGNSEPGGAEPEGVEPGGAASEGAESGGAEPHGAALSRGSAGASPRLSPQQLREWFVRRTHLRSGDSGAGGASAAGVGGTGVAGTCGVEGAGAGDLTESGTTSAGGSGAGGAGVGGPGAGGAGVGGPGVGGAGAGGARALDPGGAVWPQPYFVPLLQQPASPLPAPSPYTEQSGGLTERREPASRPVLPVCTACRVPRSRPPPVPGTHSMTLRPSSVPLRVPLPAPPSSSLLEVPDPESDRARAASPTVSHLLATAVTDPSFDSAAASALIAELLDFAAASRLDYATALVAESASASPPSVGGECALSTDVLEDRQEDFESLEVAVPRFASMLLAPEGDPDAQDIPTPRSYAEANTGTYVDKVPPPGANIVDGMWIFRGVDYFQTFSPTPKMTTLWVLLHVAAQRDYELHSLDFSTAFLQGSLHKEIWLRRPPGFTESFPTGTQWSLRWPVYGLRQAPREWHDTLRTTLAALGFAPATADLSLFLRTDTSLPPFYALVHHPGQSSAHHYPDAVTHGAPGPSALWLPILLAIAHSSVYQPLALSSTFGQVPPVPMAAQELRWLTYLLTDLGEQPCSPPVLYVDKKAMIALCQEHRLEHRTKHIALRYFLARELQ